MINGIYILIAVITAVVIAAYFVTKKVFKQTAKDWETYHELEKQVKAVSTKKEANSLYIKIVNFQKNLNNSIIETRLNYLFAFLYGFLKAKENE